MIPLAQRLISAGALMAWGTVLCVLYFSGRITSYLVPTFQPFTLACGATLVLLAMLVLLAPGKPENTAGCTPAGPLWKQLLGAVVLLVPLLLALTMSKDEFGATTVLNRNYVSDVSQLPGAAPTAAPAATTPAAPSDALPGETASTTTSSDDSDSAAPPVDADGNEKAEVIDLLYAAQLPEIRPEFENKNVAVIGQLMPAKVNNPKGDRYDLVRMFMTCCAADAQPVAVPVKPDKKPGLPEMTWVKVKGKATFPVVGGQHMPLIDNATIEKTQPPDDTFLY